MLALPPKRPQQAYVPDAEDAGRAEVAMPDIRPSEVLRQIHRLSCALTHVSLTPYQKRELEGALYALAWVLRHVDTSPVEWMLPKSCHEQVDQLLATMFEPVEAPSPDAHPARPASFIERSQPAERA